MAALEGTVKLPGLGEIPKKQAAIAGGAVAAIVGVGYYRKRQADAAALAAGTDSGIMSTEGTNALGDTSAIGPGGGFGGPVTSTGDPVPAPINLQNPGILTNQDWKSAGASTDLGGIDASVISSALSKVLGGVPVTQAEAEIFQEVAGEIGYPPQGYPPIRLVTTTPGTPKPPPPPTAKLTNTYTARNQSMLQIEQIAHPGASLTDSESRALNAIHYNIANGRNRWPSGIAGKDLINRKISGAVYVV